MQHLAQHLRDGRGGHEQDVDRAALAGQRLPVRDAEPVLLVDHGEPQVHEPDGLTDEGLGAHEHEPTALPEEACGHGRRGELERGTALGGAHAGGQEDHLVAEGLEQPCQGRRVLACQEVGGRQERRLTAGIGDERHGECGDSRLAGADIALDEAHHRPPGCEVRADRLHRDQLVRREPDGRVCSRARLR